MLRFVNSFSRITSGFMPGGVLSFTMHMRAFLVGFGYQASGTEQIIQVFEEADRVVVVMLMMAASIDQSRVTRRIPCAASHHCYELPLLSKTIACTG